MYFEGEPGVAGVRNPLSGVPLREGTLINILIRTGPVVCSDCKKQEGLCINQFASRGCMGVKALKIREKITKGEGPIHEEMMQIVLLLQSHAVDAVAHGCHAENQTELVETDVLTVGIERLRARLFGRETA